MPDRPPDNDETLAETDEDYETVMERLRPALPRILSALVVIGAAFWAVCGSLWYVLAFGVAGQPAARLVLWLETIDGVGERVCLASTAVLVALFLYERLTPSS